MRVVGYLRVSTIEQADSRLGLDAQRSTIQAEADRRGWEVVWVEDAGRSGRDLVRPGIERAMELLRSGEAGGLVVAKLDRLSRSLMDFAALMARANREGWRLVALDLGVDTSSPAGEMVANVMASFAQYERRLIGQRTREALQARRASGLPLGRPRLLSAETIARIADLRADGLTLRAIAETLTASGVPTAQGRERWSHTQVFRALTPISVSSGTEVRQ